MGISLSLACNGMIAVMDVPVIRCYTSETGSGFGEVGFLCCVTAICSA